MKKIIIISSSILVVIAAIFLFRENTKKKAFQNEIEQFNFVKRMNARLLEKLSDSTIFQLSGFNHTMKYEKEEYLTIIGKKLMDDIYKAAKDKKLHDVYMKTDKYDMYVESGNYSIFTVKFEPLFIKDYRVTQLVYYEEGNLTKQQFKKMESVYKFEKLERMEEKWYKVIYIKNSGKNFNL